MRKPYTKRQQLHTEASLTPTLDKWAAAYTDADVQKGIQKLRQAVSDINGALSVVEDGFLYINKFIAPAAGDALLKDLTTVVSGRLRTIVRSAK